MTGTAVDSYSPHTEQSATALELAGIRLALRYHYNLSDAEREILHRHAVAVGMIGEYDSLTWHPILAGAAAGDRHGLDIVSKAIARGFPRGSVLWGASDTGVPPSSYAVAALYAAAYAARVRAAGYRVGWYGGEGLVDYLFVIGLADVGGWGTGATSWNYGHRSDRLALRQLLGYSTFGGVQTDTNDRLGDEGAWLPPGDNPPPAPPPDPTEELSVTDVQVILDKINDLGLGLLALQLNAGAPRTAFQVKGRDSIEYIADGPTGNPIRVHLVDPAEVDALKQVGWLDYKIVELDPGTDDAPGPHAALVKALDAIPLTSA